MNIYPSYKCNLQCDFCGLWKQEGKTIDLEWLKNQFSEHPDLAKDINVLGGEPSILPIEYQNELVDICSRATGEPPYYVTNLMQISPVLYRTKPIISYDFRLRKFNYKVKQNLLKLNFPFALSTILTNNLVSEVGAHYYLQFINQLQQCYRADLVIYYPEKGASSKYIPNEDNLLAFVGEVIKNPKVCLAPLQQMLHIVPGSFEDMSDFFALLPGNKYGVRLDYQNGPYAEFDTYEEAKEYYEEKIKTGLASEPCKDCPYTQYCWYPVSDTVCHGEKKMMDLFYDYARKSV